MVTECLLYAFVVILHYLLLGLFVTRLVAFPSHNISISSISSLFSSQSLSFSLALCFAPIFWFWAGDKCRNEADQYILWSSVIVAGIVWFAISYVAPNWFGEFWYKTRKHFVNACHSSHLFCGKDIDGEFFFLFLVSIHVF